MGLDLKELLVRPRWVTHPSLELGGALGSGNGALVAQR